MNIMIIGGLKETHFLTKHLSSKGHRVTIINRNREQCINLSKMNPKAVVVHGDATHPDVLDDAKAHHMDIVVSLTSKDSDNLMICRLAKNVFRVPRTFAVINDPMNINVFKELGVDIAMSPAQTLSLMIEQSISIEDIKNIIPIDEGKLSIYELDIKENDPCVGLKLKELDLPNQSNIAYMLRKDTPLVPSGDTQICSGDTLVIVSMPNVQSETIKKMKGRLD